MSRDSPQGRGLSGCLIAFVALATAVIAAIVAKWVHGDVGNPIVWLTIVMGVFVTMCVLEAARRGPPS